jgi:glutathione S-transferase
MQLFHSSGSPYARIARMAVLELGLEGRVSFSETTLRDPASSRARAIAGIGGWHHGHGNHAHPDGAG